MYFDSEKKGKWLKNYDQIQDRACYFSIVFARTPKATKRGKGDISFFQNYYLE